MFTLQRAGFHLLNNSQTRNENLTWRGNWQTSDCEKRHIHSKPTSLSTCKKKNLCFVCMFANACRWATENQNTRLESKVKRHTKAINITVWRRSITEIPKYHFQIGHRERWDREWLKPCSFPLPASKRVQNNIQTFMFEMIPDAKNDLDHIC